MACFHNCISLLALFHVASASEIFIDQYGAMSEQDTDFAAMQNGFALAEALTKASAGDVVVVPAGKSYYFFPNRTLVGLNHVTLQIDGIVKARTSFASWPTDKSSPASNKVKYLSIFEFINCTGLTLQGSGTVDGQGSSWWWAFALGRLKLKRPLMLVCTNCIDLEIKDLHFLNSPRFHLLINGHGVKIHNISIVADWALQRRIHTDWKQALQSKKGSWQPSSTMFPFNTDGIDPSGTNIHIYNCSISNYDDVIAVKPGGMDDPTEGCTENVLVEDLTVYVGAGLSVGSVHPATTRNCVRNIMFRNINMYSPLKGVYVKPDLGTEGTAIIENVTYENIMMHQANTPGGLKPPHWPSGFAEAELKAQEVSDIQPLQSDEQAANGWSCLKLDYTCMEWPIYLGTQQQLEPDGSGSGIWPATEPKVTVKDVTLRKVHSHGGIWPNCAGVLRCNSSNPCSGVTLDDVVIEGTFLKCPLNDKFVCDDDKSILGTLNAVTPSTKCIRSTGKRFGAAAGVIV